MGFPTAIRRRLIVITAVLACTGVASVLPATADVYQPRVVSADPVDWTPHVLDGTIRAIAVVGDTVVVGGDFSDLTDSGRRTRYEQPYLFAFGLHDGELRQNFAPRVDGPVYALAAGADGTVYVGGAFTAIAGQRQRGLARLRVSDGRPADGFTAAINYGDVRALAVHGARLYAGGAFTAINGTSRLGLARLDAGTGAVDQGFDAKLTAVELSRVRVEDFALSPDGSRLVAIGAITQAAGQARHQLVLLDTTGPGAGLLPWYTDVYRYGCDASYETYLRGVDFSPDGSWFVVVSTGNNAGPDRMCDTAARFETAGSGRRTPTWVNHTGGNTLFAVAVTGSAVYVGGHQQWLDNPHGNKTAGPGAVSRPGIGAIHPGTGRALPWNPTRTRGVGVRAFAATPYGLFVGSDTDQLGHEYHGRIGMFPL